MRQYPKNSNVNLQLPHKFYPDGESACACYASLYSFFLSFVPFSAMPAPNRVSRSHDFGLNSGITVPDVSFLRGPRLKVWTPTGSITHEKGAEDHFSPPRDAFDSCLGRWLGRMDDAGEVPAKNYP